MPKKNKDAYVAPEINRIIRKLCDRGYTPLKKIAMDTGLPAPWLSKLATGKIVDPSYTKIKILLHYLFPGPQS